MLTQETTAIFASRMAAYVSDRALHNGVTIADLMDAEAAWQQDYQARYAVIYAALECLSPRVLSSALAMLNRLGGAGCLSGSAEYCDTLRGLEAIGIHEANQVFEHDRRALAAFAASKSREIA